jgi:hypothetical protein
MIAYCGLKCDSCPIYLATSEPDESLRNAIRESVAEQCNKQYGMNLLAADVTDCDGCRSDTGRLFSGCRACEIRECASLKNIENCACCSYYICDRLKAFFQNEPDAQRRLDEFRLKI